MEFQITFAFTSIFRKPILSAPQLLSI